MKNRRLEFKTPQAILESLRLRTKIVSPTSEVVPVENAPRRALAEDVISTLDVPGFVRPWVDGYATRAKWTQGPSATRPVTLLLTEGFHAQVSRRSDIFKVVAAKDENDATNTLEGTSAPILAIARVITTREIAGIPVVDLERNERLSVNHIAALDEAIPESNMPRFACDSFGNVTGGTEESA